MSLEAAIKENTEELKRNTEAVRKHAEVMNVGKPALGGSKTPVQPEKAGPQRDAVSWEKDTKGWALALAKHDPNGRTGRAALNEIYAKYSVKVGAELNAQQLTEAHGLIVEACKKFGITEAAKPTAK